MRFETYFSGFLLWGALATHGQVPLIQLADKEVAAPGEKIILSGSDFGTGTTDKAVFFGAAKGTLLQVTDRLIEVRVPTGATFDALTFINKATGLKAQTPRPFLPSFDGTHPFNAANLSTQTDFNAESGLYDLCLCDLDDDGKVDIAAANDNAGTLSLFRNTSSPGTLSVVKTSLTLPGGATRALHISCGDLNGDAKPDLVASEGGEGTRVFVFRNNSTTGSLSFTASSITLTGRKPKQIELADLDGDGKADLVVTDQKSGNVLVIPNNSTTAALAFGTALAVPIPGALSTDGIAVKDLDGDLLPEVIVNQFLSANSNIFIARNKSTPGQFHLEDVITLSAPGTLVNLKVGDLNADGRPDLAATQLLSSGITIFPNTTETVLQFGSPVDILTDERPWGIDFGDLDGDKRPDIVVASITKKSVTILNNTSTAGGFTFQPTVVPTSFINRHIRLGDLDSDGKPDISFTSIDDNNLGIPASKISIMRNTSCVTPVIEPKRPLTICAGFVLQLNASVTSGTYEWLQNGTPVATGTDAFYAPTATGTYSVKLTSEAGACIKISNEVTVTVVAAASAGVPSITTNTPVCLDATLNLTVTSTGATGFDWRGPGNFSATGASVNRPDFTAADVGRYEVDVLVGTCIAQQASVLIDVISLPPFRVAFAGSSIVCDNGTKVLSVSPASGDFTYQWFEESAGLLTGETNTDLTVTTSGNYYFEATSTVFPGCPAVQADQAEIKFLDTPVVSFEAPGEACRGKAVSFTDQSTTDPDADAFYQWNFGGAGSSTDRNPSFTFNTSQSFNVQLTVSYSGNACAASITKSLIISPPPVATITSASGFSLCQGQTLTLGVSPSFQTYLWSNNATTPTIDVTQPGSVSVTGVTAIGCEVTATQTIALQPAPVVTVAAEPAEISIGESAQLTASGLEEYLWQPGQTLSDSTIANPQATPTVTTVYTVTGTSASGCIGEATVTVTVRQENISDVLRPANFFSPNGDAVNNLWEVGNILFFPQCEVQIFDEKGIKVYEAKPYQNDWDGTRNGQPLPSGVYFYLFRCEGDPGKPKTGSITLIR